MTDNCGCQTEVSIDHGSEVVKKRTELAAQPRHNLRQRKVNFK